MKSLLLFFLWGLFAVCFIDLDKELAALITVQVK